MSFAIPPQMHLGSWPTEAQLRARTQWKRQFEAMTRDIMLAANRLGERKVYNAETERLQAAEVRKQRRLLMAYRKSLTHIARLSNEGRISGVTQEVARVLRSFAARGAAIILDKHDDARVLRWTDVEQRAGALCLWRPCFDPLTWKGEEKDDGSVRPALAFGWRHRAQQRVLRDLLLAAGVWNEFEFSCTQKGPSALLQCIKRGVEGGCRFWVIADIRNYFASVRPGHLRGLLPVKGAEWDGLLFIPTATPITGRTPDTLKGAALAGLPQGSMVSPRIASALIGREIRKAISGNYGVAGSFADDIAIGARTQQEAEAIRDALQEGCSSLKAGPLTFKHIKVAAAVDGFDIVQRRVRHEVWDGKGRVRVRPSATAFKRLRNSARQKFGDVESPSMTEPLREYITRWAAGLDWEPREGWIDIVLETVVRDPHKLGLAELPAATVG